MIDSKNIKRVVPIEVVIGHFIELKQDGREFVGLCPFHKEKTPSLKVTPSKGLFTCFGCNAGGDAIDFVRKLKRVDFKTATNMIADITGKQLPTTKTEPLKPQIVATYQYRDERGDLLYEVCRLEPGEFGKKKSFRQRRKHPTDGSWVWGISEGEYFKSKRNGEWYPVKEGNPGEASFPETRRLLFNLTDVLTADTVWLAEGEKDALSLAKLGLTATTASGGAKAPWIGEFTEALRNRNVILLPDGDEAGRNRARTVADALEGAVASLTILYMPEGAKDVTEWLGQPRNEKDGFFGSDLEEPRGLDDLMCLLERSVELEREKEYERKGLLTGEEVLSRIRGGVSVFLDPTKREKGLITGYTILDDLTLGFHRGELTILAARPAVGKTAICLNIAERVAERHKRAVAIFSLEMNSDQLLQRMMCGRARVDMQRFRAGHLNTDEKKALRKALLELLEMPIFFDDAPMCTSERIEAKLKLLAQRQEIGLVIVDYLQLMRSKKSKGAENRTLEVGAFSRDLKLLSKQFQSSFLVLSQLSRKCEERTDKRPMLSDLRESGEIEQNADNIAFLYRDEMYNKDERVIGEAELIQAKQRQGPTGMVPLTYIAKYTRFENRAESHRQIEEPDIPWAA